MRAILSVLLTITIAGTAAAAIRFEPQAPTADSEIILYMNMIWPSSCLPQNAQVTRSGNTINVVWAVPSDGACLPSGFPWVDSVLIGSVPPGIYDVNVRVTAAAREDPFSTTLKLFVRDAAPEFSVAPSFASTRGGSEVRVTDDSFCNARSPQVIVDGTSVPVRVDGCTLVATLQPHAAGVVDVVVHNETDIRRVRSAVRYLDPGEAPDDDVFERVLVPLLYIGAGAFGSQWTTQAELFHRGAIPMPWFPDVARPRCDFFPGCEDVVQPNDTIPLTVYGQRSNGLVLFLPRELARDIHFGAIVRDVSREQTSWGAQLPIVREKDFRSGEIVLPNVVVDPRYRSMLRIYGVDGVGTQVQVQASDSQPIVVTLGGPCTETPCNSNEPAFASLDVASTFRGLVGRATTLVIRPADGVHRLWAFASITNNDSQHVTVITPQ
ncbi:MAG TPA: hypothetical protein VHL59_01340 [Thermoanaerobaculia bacterium]|nr:hypothetical protein [Thermoanaerobaculia bacterium]